ncbi:uncharacterized protein J7T54_001973 [Emericellopsis cladophorae]|uniref:WSC domain-containing protein n=1 Tax=Emericellopsis cladophorae TaxID=2686198 RepID=A0A9Q0BCT6_9HYPO|nr:uncharacterized protein J7T54_001973 [Emericellopsis cladophorae]KAI6779885.1 hypothetical protein J7T54_001973 [Emericellopsis cladophorae]
MASPISSRAGLGALLLFAATPAFVSAVLPLDLCASFNSGTTDEFRDDYQTNGLCFDHCKEDYAFAITQQNSCWCSDFAPSEDSQVDMERCDLPCPAFPDENCGGRGLYGYVTLNGKLPEGTRGPTNDEPSSTTTSEEPTSTETTQEESTSQEPSTTTTATSTEEESTTTTTATTTTKSKAESTTTTETDTDDPQSTTMTQTVTTDGEVRTVTVIPTITSDSGNSGNSGESANDSTGSQSKDDDGGLGTGAVVGIVVGVIGAVLVAAGVILFWFFKRRKRNQQSDFTEDPSVRGNSSDRVGSSNPEMSMGAGALSGAGSNSPTSTSNRNSMLAIDPRMDPFKQGLYMRTGSHESINTLRDDHDYSRRIQSPKVLRATNPDPDNHG